MDQSSEYEQFKNAVLAQFDFALSMDIEQTPTYKTMIKIRDHLLDLGFRPELADRVVVKANIAVDEMIFEDLEFINTVTLRFAQIVDKLYNYSMEVFHGRTEDKIERFVDMIDGMSLNLLPNV